MINQSNYFSLENNLKYMSNSQYKNFCNCEASALAMVKCEYQEEKTTALLIGSYVDSYFSGTLEQFKAENPGIFATQGKNKNDLRSEYQHANYIIKRIERDPYFMKFLGGEKQVVKTGEIFGVPFKIKIDSYFPEKCIVDQKILKDMQKIWCNGLYLNFIEYWGYDYQGCFYQNIEGNKLPFILAVATKEKEPDLRIISVPQERLDYCLSQAEINLPRYAAIKRGEIEPIRCEKCDYCKSTRVLTEIIDYQSLT